jgi:leader peptidase (prepilin peptidase) / N-methyltransferase
MELLFEAAPKTFFAFVFAFGAVVGSFLNVVIARVPAGESIASPPSRCPRCQRPIDWYDNVPILSWLALRARCRGCALPISARYPLVESLTGLLALGVAWRFGPTLPALAFFTFAAMLVALAFIDLDHFWLPEVISLPLLGLGLLSPLWNPELGLTLDQLGVLPGRPLLQAFAASVTGALVGGGFLFLVGKVGSALLGKEAMGLGDVVLLAGIGAWLGVQSIFFVLMFSSIQGTAVGIWMLRRRRAAEAAAVAGAAPLAGPAAAARPIAQPEGSPIDKPAEAIDSQTDRPLVSAIDNQAAAIDNQIDNSATPAGVEPAGVVEPAGDPAAGEGAEGDDWQPDPHHVPFGPFLALAALEQLLFGDAIWAGWMELMNRLWSAIDHLWGLRS